MHARERGIVGRAALLLEVAVFVQHDDAVVHGDRELQNSCAHLRDERDLAEDDIGTKVVHDRDADDRKEEHRFEPGFAREEQKPQDHDDRHDQDELDLEVRRTLRDRRVHFVT